MKRNQQESAAARTAIASGALSVWGALLLAFAATSGAAAPRLYAQPAHESPVRAGPDDLLLIPGYGLAADDTVVYRALTDTTQVLTPPDSIPADSTASQGVAESISTANIPYSLTVRLPRVMRGGQSYALWVRAPSGAWSNGILVNDARPLWLTPAYAYETKAVADLPRVLRVVGRNLAPAEGRSTQIRLTGPKSVTLTARGADASSAMTRYVAEVDLPTNLPPGDYSVAVSRDGVSWVSLRGQPFTVRPNPVAQQDFAVDSASFGGCRPDDGRDDTACLMRAIEAARTAGGGTVAFGPGVWDLSAESVAGLNKGEGITLPLGVSLRGSGAEATRLIRHSRWSGSSTDATFTLTGHNTVEGLTFADTHTFHPDDPPVAALRVGKVFYRADPARMDDPKVVEDVVISHVVFDKPFIGIGDGGLPIRRLFVTHDEFGAYQTGLALSGNRYNKTYRFGIEDSVIAYNTFRPGSYVDPAAAQGAMASTMGASHRVDFSHNRATGASTRFLSSPQDAAGWRAAFFWHMTDSHEQMLVAQNQATCTGDKIGDGEAIAFDGNVNTYAFDSARTTLGSTLDTVTVPGVLKSRQDDRDVKVANYYAGQWLQVTEGPGVGQTRRIDRYYINPLTSQVTFKVSPVWDVPPVAGSTRITVGRQYWQVYTLDNDIDHRKPPCRKSNPTRPKGGAIALWAPTADSVVEGNTQRDADGILFQQGYSAVDPACPKCASWISMQYFVEIWRNTIDGEYDWTSDCSQSGILASQGASPTPGSPPPVVSYGVSIAYNTIRHADGLRGGAITVPLTWDQGPPPHNWPLVNNLLIHHNSIEDLAGPAPRRQCDNEQIGRVGINLYQAETVWRTVLYANSCRNVTRPLHDGGSSTVRVCPPGESGTCECPDAKP